MPESFCSDLAIEGENDMAWAIGDQGFEMKLSTYVPSIIKKWNSEAYCKSTEQDFKAAFAMFDILLFIPAGERFLKVLKMNWALPKRITNQPIMF